MNMKTKLSTNVLHRRSAAVVRLLALTVSLLFAQTSPVASAEDRKLSELLMDPPRIRPSDLLQRERDIPKLRAFIAADLVLPERVVLVNTVRGNEPPVRIAMHVRGSETHRCVLVMIHGVLANHESWRYLTGALGSDFDLLIVDLPGCGDSDKPDPKSLAPDGYSPTAIADRVFQAIEKYLATRNDSPHVILVAHSLGGMITLRMMSDPELRRRYASVLKQIDGAVLLAPADVSVNHEMAWAVQIVKLSGLKVKIGNVLGVVQDATAQSTKDGFISPRMASREVADQFVLHSHPCQRPPRRAGDARSGSALARQGASSRLGPHSGDRGQLSQRGQALPDRVGRA